MLAAAGHTILVKSAKSCDPSIVSELFTVQTVARVNDVSAIHNHGDAGISIVGFNEPKQEVVQAGVDARNHAITDESLNVVGQFRESTLEVKK